jgi:photosystem II stability/assembly factor-like uncharacterized protein
MKVKFVLLPVIFLCFVSTAISQWQWLNPKPAGYTNSKVIFIDSLKGFILNSNGDLLKTTDQGTNWSLVQNFPNATTMDMVGSTGVICGYSGTLYITKDNATTWQKINTGITEYYFRADIINKDTMFLSNSSGKIYRSDDGGNTWTTLNSGIQISSMEFINSKVGYVGGASRYILKTEDGGVTWQPTVQVNHSPSNTLTIKFFDINTGFAFREHSSLLRTTDGGKTWNEYNMGDDIYSFNFVSAKIAFASGEHGVIYRTDDGGITWKWIGASGRIYAYDLYSTWFINSNTGFSVGARGRILKTTDGGASWNTYSPTYLNVSDISVPTHNIAYATVSNTVLKTIDKGQTWKQLELSIGTTFQYSHFFNADTGLVIANDYARIYKTSDGGANWKIINPAPYGYNYARDLHFINQNIGFLSLDAIGNATIVKTKDAGETWSTVWGARYQGEVFHKIHFIDEKTGYASRYEKFYKTEDSAKTWKELWSEGSKDISSIWFINPKTGFVAGEEGLLKRTNDSGKTWTSITISTPFNDDFYTIKLFNEEVGYLTSENGIIYKTVDGGNSWEQNGKANFYKMSSLKFAPDSTVYVVGEYGSILTSEVSEYHISPISINTINNCSTEISTLITAVLSSVDSLKLEFGINNFDSSVNANPSVVTNMQQVVKASISKLPPSTSYKARIKFFYRGRYHFTNEVKFKTQDRPATPSISVSGNTIFCDGDNIVLTSSANAGNQWHLNGVAINGANHQNYTATQTGTYQVVRTTGCYVSDTGSVRITVNATPAKPTITSSKNILTSSASSGNQWSFNGKEIPGATETKYSALLNGYYTVRVKQNGCVSAVSDTVDFIIPGSKITTYPNPVKDNVTIRNSLGEKMIIQITDASGNVVYQGVSSSSSFSINMQAMQRGIYFFKVTFEGNKENFTKKIVKQ